MKSNWIILTLTVALLAAVSFFTLRLYYGASQEVLSRFEKDRLSYVKHLSNEIRFYIHTRSQGLRALASLASLRQGDARKERLDIEAYANSMEKVYIKSISLYDDRGTTLYSTDWKTIGSKNSGNEFFAWTQKSENRDKISLTPALRESQSLTFIMAIPLYQPGPDSLKTNEKFSGVLALTLDMKEFLANQLGFSEPKMNLDQIWIMDRDGTLLFQPGHPEMALRNIYQKEASCQSCHRSFKYIEDMLTKAQGSMDYKIERHPKKIAAFASMEGENISWVVVVNSPYDEVTGFIKDSLLKHLTLLGIVVLAFAIGSAFVIRNERSKIKAEQEDVRWQEKMAERQKALETLELESNKLKGILDSINDGVYIVNQQFEILYSNPSIEMEGAPAKGRKCYEYFHDQPGVCTWCKSKEVFAGETIRWEWHSVRTGKTYDVFDTPFMGSDGRRCKLQFRRDISGRKRVEKALRQSEKRYRLLVDTMNEGLVVQNEHGEWIYVNERFSEMLGYSRDEMIGRPVTDFVVEQDWTTYREQVAKRRRGERESYGLSWLRKDGKMILTRMSPQAIFDEHGQFKGSFAVVTDITERKRAEEALKESEKQLRHLSSQLLTAQETERRRISRELHDELGQALTVMKLRLNFIGKNLPDDQAELKSECEDGIRYVDQVIEDVRRLSRDLSPTILEDFGLSAAIRWLVNNFARSYNIRVMLDMIDIDSLLPRDSHVVVYRTVQEALTNIGKHSKGRHVSIAIREDNDMILFSIEDDGTGFDQGLIAARSLEESGLGLATMKGRARMAGGDLHIGTKEGEGTVITLRVPRNRG